MTTRAIPGPWPAAERLLVCIGPGPLAERLVRAGRRMADQLDAEWFAIYVETHRHAGLSEGERDRVARMLRMAEELGATTTRLPGNTIAETVTRHAHLHNITKILIAEPLYPRWVEWLRGSVVADVIRGSGGIDVYVVGAEGREPTNPYPFRPRWTAPWQDYLKGAVMVGLATALGAVVDIFAGPDEPGDAVPVGCLDRRFALRARSGQLLGRVERDRLRLLLRPAAVHLRRHRCPSTC